MRPPGQQKIPAVPKSATTVPKVSNVIPMPKAAQAMPVSNVIPMPKAAQVMPMQNVANVIKMPKAAQAMPMQNVVTNAADFLPKTPGNQPGTSTGPRNSLIQPQQPVRGNIDVNFKNAPQGMRVTPTKAGGPVSVTPNVGYRSFAGGSA
jgi:hypothetical protein